MRILIFIRKFRPKEFDNIDSRNNLIESRPAASVKADPDLPVNPVQLFKTPDFHFTLEEQGRML
jgi:hypothetical protein